MIFESNSGGVDTIFLEGIDSKISPTDPLDVFPTKIEHFYILNKHIDPSPPDGTHRYLDGHILVKISANKNKDTRLRIDFAAKDAWFYGDTWLTKSELNNKPTISLTIDNIVYDDIKVFTDDEKEYYDMSNHVDKIYWSLSNGIVRFDKKDNEIWTLKKKYAQQQ